LPARVVWNTADRLIAMIASHLPGGKLSTGETCWIPALLTRISGGPSSSAQRLIIRSIAAGSDRSAPSWITPSSSGNPLDFGWSPKPLIISFAPWAASASDRQADARGRSGNQRDLSFQNHEMLLSHRYSSREPAFATVVAARALDGREEEQAMVRLGGDEATISSTAPEAAGSGAAAGAATCSDACCRWSQAASESSEWSILLLGYCALQAGGGGGLLPGGSGPRNSRPANRPANRP
jgi:hypothetical protein